MKDKNKTKRQLINELMEMRQRIAELEAVESECKRTEEALRIKNYAISSSINGIAINDLDGKFIYVNDSFVKMVGCVSDQELLGKSPLEFALDRDEASKAMKTVIDRGIWFGELAAKRKNGSIFCVQLSANLIKDEVGKPIYTMASFIDITERKRAEEALRKSEERFRSFLDDLGDVAYMTDSQGNVTYTNKMAEKMTGIPLEDIIGKPFLPLFAEENQKIVIDLYQRTLNGESAEYELTLTNGRICYFKSEPLRDKDAEIIGVFGIARDITDRKRAEEKLRQSEEKYRTLIESSIDGIGVATDGKMVFGSKGLLKMFGFDRLEEAIGKPIDSVVAPKFREKFKLRHLKRLRGEITGTSRSEFEGLRKDGTTMDIEASFNTISYQGKPAVLAILRDITENKRMMMKLEESEEKYRKLFENANDAIFITDMKTGIMLDANRKAEQLIGRPREEIIGMHQSKLYPPNCAESYWRFRKHVQRNHVVDLEAGIIKKDGSIVPVLITASAIRLGGKQVTQSIFRDLTKEKGISELKEEILKRKLIDKAKGILMDRHKINEKDAMRRLQKESRSQRKKIQEIAEAVISSELILN